MIRAVIDTNVLVSAARTPNGNPAKIVEMVRSMGKIQIYYSMDIVTEYRNVLSRPKFDFSTDIQSRIIDAIVCAGILISPSASTIQLPDEDFVKTPSQFLNMLESYETAQ